MVLKLYAIRLKISLIRRAFGGKLKVIQMKKGKAVVVLIVILFLAAGGYLVYDTVFNVDIGNVTEVKEKKLAEIPLAWDMLEDTDSPRVFGVMLNNDASYYQIKNHKDHASIKQVNKDTFNTTGPVSSSKCYRLIQNSMKAFLNSSYDKLPDNLYESPDGKSYTLFGKMSYYGSKTALKNTFGMGLRKMFNRYELSLSCQDIDITKMAVYETGQISDASWSYSATKTYANDYFYYFIVKAKVKTLHSKKNISKLGVFAKEGKTKKITFMIRCSSDDSFKDLIIESLDVKTR